MQAITTSMLSSFNVPFPNGLTARAIQVQHRMELPMALTQFGLYKSRPVLVVIGGASNLSPLDYDRLRSFFIESLAPVAEELGMAVLDGGTDAGVMQLMGLARSAIGATFPLIGVAPANKVQIPNTFPSRTIPLGAIPLGAMPLEPHHTHFIVVPGTKWGDESPWISEIASFISGAKPSVTVLMNGGKVSLVDVQASIASGRPIVVVEGTGRLADEIATAVRHPELEATDALCSVLKMGNFTLFDLSKSAIQLQRSLRQSFSSAIDRSLSSGLNF